MTRFDRIAVVGGGAWGTALANAAAFAGRSVILWLRSEAAAAELALRRENAAYLPGIALHPRVEPTNDASRLREADGVLLVVPAQSTRATLTALAPNLPAGAPLVLCAKGIELGSELYGSEIARAVVPGVSPAILSGPGFAADVARGLPTAVALAADEGTLAAELAAALSGQTLRVYHGTDVRGVEIGGAAKNVLAIAAGVVEGRGLGESARAALIARGFAELLRYALAEGGRPETLMGLSGLGDLVLTCSSPQSRNHALGRALGEGRPPVEASDGKLAEGALSAAALVGRARRLGVELPIGETVTRLLAAETDLDHAIEALMSRPLRAES